MKCPLLAVMYRAEIPKLTLSLIECLKEECAWWLDEMDRCALPEIAVATGAIAEHLSVIREYGPGNEPE